MSNTQDEGWECCDWLHRARAAEAENARLREQLAAVTDERDGLAQWACSECGARFTTPYRPPHDVVLEGVKRCSACVEREIFAAMLGRAHAVLDGLNVTHDVDGVTLTVAERLGHWQSARTQAEARWRDTEDDLRRQLAEAQGENEHLRDEITTLRRHLGAERDDLRRQLTEAQRQAFAMEVELGDALFTPGQDWDLLIQDATNLCASHEAAERELDEAQAKLAEARGLHLSDYDAKVRIIKELFEAFANHGLARTWKEQIDDLRRQIPAPRTTDRPTVVCLCGSTRFMDAFFEAGWQETLAGKIVLSVGVCKHADANGGHGAEMLGPDVADALDELHKRKIDLADEVLILNVNGYVGQSTRSELEYAQAHGKRVRYLEPILADDIAEEVLAMTREQVQASLADEGIDMESAQAELKRRLEAIRAQEAITPKGDADANDP